MAKLADRPLDSLRNVPQLAAPSEGGQWTNRATSTLEAKRWPLSILRKSLGKDPEMTTIHCLKSTALSLAGKAGLGAEVRRVLGHHSTGKRPHEIYSRDLLADPLRQLEMLAAHPHGCFLARCIQIRDGEQLRRTPPKASGKMSASLMILKAARLTPRLPPMVDLNSDDLPDVLDPIVEHEVWNPNFKMYKHVRTQVVHL